MVLNVDPDVVGIGVESCLIHAVDVDWCHHWQRDKNNKNQLRWKAKRDKKLYKI